MYGQPRNKIWTTAASTIQANSNILAVSEDVDWKVGEEIVVASTSYDHEESEKKTITAISGRTITVDTAFKFRHEGTV